MSDIRPTINRKAFPGMKKARVLGKGQFTIPADIRKRLGIEEDTILEVFQVGRAMIATPEKLTVKALAEAVQKDISKNNIDLKQLLEELREGSHKYEAE